MRRFLSIAARSSGFANSVDFWSCHSSASTRRTGSLRGDIRLTTFMASPALVIASGQTNSDGNAMLRNRATALRTDFDAAVFQTSSANAKGEFSFAHSCDMGSVVSPRSKRNVLFVNEQMRALPNAESISADKSL